jgi:hypothetical protein
MTTPRLITLAVFSWTCTISFAADLSKVEKVERQPLAAQAERVANALEYLGSPLSEEDRKTLTAAATDKDEPRAVKSIQSVLDPLCLAIVKLSSKDKDLMLEQQGGPARRELAEQGWRTFLIKVENPGGVKNVRFRTTSPNAEPMLSRSTGRPDPELTVTPEQAKTRFLELSDFTGNPLLPQLSGLELEYRVVQIYCRDAGEKKANLGFNVLTDADKPVLLTASKQTEYAFKVEHGLPITLEIKDEDDKPVTAAFVFRDARGRVYPAPTRRLAPDFFFHAQVYRADGETILLQPGKYTVTCSRGPEYVSQTREINFINDHGQTEEFKLKRWIHPAAHGWWSGDHHIHAAGCSHYESPTEGVTPADMMRHVLGEDLNVGCCLSWGPCWYYQKKFFEGKVNEVSKPDHLLRYDVEVSGFPSSHCGHICLLGLREQDYPGTKRIEDWPSWDLPIFRWAKSQGAVVGFAHSGWGLEVDSKAPLPNDIIPPMNGIGANEYLVDVAHGMCDFISTVDTPAPWELNIWYHTLNCGYCCRISGETDFPCIFGERVGIGRSYVHLDGKLDFDAWVQGIKDGRSYVSDGKSHLMDFAVNDTEVGKSRSEVKLTKPGKVKVHAKVAALMEPTPTEATEKTRKTRITDKPYWDVERARIGTSRKAPVEVVVNGIAVDKKEIEADGSLQDVTFEVPIEISSWVCLRIFPSSHTNPVFILVGDKPIRASKNSADWCLKAIDKCWDEKSKKIAKNELDDAQKAYDEARKAYRKIADECTKD